MTVSVPEYGNLQHWRSRVRVESGGGNFPAQGYADGCGAGAYGPEGSGGDDNAFEGLPSYPTRKGYRSMARDKLFVQEIQGEEVVVV